MGAIGAGTAEIRGASVYDGAIGTIERFEAGTFMVTVHGVELPFGCHEIGELQLSKGDALKLSDKADPRMPEFLKALSAWAEAHGTAGRTVVADPLEGPGTMRWRIER